MDQNINLQSVSTKYYNYEPDSMVCHKVVNLNLYGTEHMFEAYGESFCQDDDNWDESLGKALAWIRASHEIANLVENYLIKYTCTQHVGEIQATLKLDTKQLENSLDRILEKASEINKEMNKWGYKHGK